MLRPRGRTEGQRCQRTTPHRGLFAKKLSRAMGTMAVLGRSLSLKAPISWRFNAVSVTAVSAKIGILTVAGTILVPRRRKRERSAKLHAKS